LVTKKNKKNHEHPEPPTALQTLTDQTELRNSKTGSSLFGISIWMSVLVFVLAKKKKERIPRKLQY
jgi:hypothetical protein